MADREDRFTQDDSLYEKFKELIKDGELGSDDIEALRLETGVSDAIFRDTINAGLAVATTDPGEFDIEDGTEIKVLDANGNNLWGYDPDTGEGGIKLQEYRDLLGYIDDNTYQADLEEFKDELWKQFEGRPEGFGEADGENKSQDTISFNGINWRLNVDGKDEFYDQLDAFFSDTEQGRLIKNTIAQGEAVGSFDFFDDGNGNFEFAYVDPNQQPGVVAEEEEEEDLYTGTNWDDIAKGIIEDEPWEIEYQDVSELGRFYNFDRRLERPDGLFPEDQEFQGPQPETWAEEFERISGEVAASTERYEEIKADMYTMDDVMEAINLFQPQQYEVPDYGIQDDITERKNKLDELAKFDPDPISYQGPVQVLPEYEQPVYEYVPPDRRDYGEVVFDPLDPGPVYERDPIYDPGLPDPTPTEPDPTEPTPTEPTPTEPEAWSPQWDERLFTGGKNQRGTSGQTQVVSNGNVYDYDFSATKDGNFSYTLTDRNTGQQIDYSDLDETGKAELSKRFDFDNRDNSGRDVNANYEALGLTRQNAL